MCRGSRIDRLTGSKGAGAISDDGRIGRDHAHVARLDAELLGADLREGRHMALALRGRTGQQGDGAGRPDAHGGTFKRAETRAFDGAGDADADIAAVFQGFGFALLEAIVIGGVHHLFQQLRIIAGIVGQRLAVAECQAHRIGHGFGRDQVAFADLGTVETELGRRRIHDAFHGEDCLRPSGAAHWGDWRLVRQHHVAVDLVGRDDEGAGHGSAGNMRQDRAVRHERALVVRHIDAQAEDLALGIQRHLDIPILIAFLRRRVEMLAPILDPFDRPLQHDRGDGCDDRFGIEAHLRAEAAADIVGDDAHALFIPIQ